MQVQAVNFYGVNATINVTQTLSKVLIKLLIKTLEDKKNSIIYSSSLAFLQELDDFLWTNAEWLPHGMVTDHFKEKQPIILTNQLVNCNNASYLFIVGNSEFENLQNIDKVGIIFNINDIEQVNLFNKQWKSLQMSNFDLKYFRQDKQGKFQNAIP